MERDKYAITGSHGFIGEHLVAKIGEENIERLDRSGFIPKSADIIFNLSAYGNLASHLNLAPEIYKANLWRVIDNVETISQEAIYIFVSSSSVTLPNQTWYSASKKAAEDVVKLAASEYGLNAVVVRPYSITGVGEQKQHLIPKLIDSCLNGTEMPFVSEPVHDFLDVEDFCDALLIVAQNAKEHKGEIFSIGSGKQYSNEEVLQLVESATGKKANIKSVDSMRNYDTTEWRSDNTAMYALGWEPKKTLQKSIEDMVMMF